VKAHFREHAPPPSVDLYFFDGGYCGVQPITVGLNGDGAIINACAMVRTDVATDLKQVLRCHEALAQRSQGWQQVIDTLSTSPLVFHEPELVQDRMLQVGDAATFVDPFIGDGISLALRSGALAAECLRDFFLNQASLEEASAVYESEYRRLLAPVFRASSRLRSLLRFPALVRRPVMSMLERAPRITRQLVRMTR
jgi:2-polyprenyl-6-methoxyphenol hydroxylase-like FAD-dependent oxidoreductase